MPQSAGILLYRIKKSHPEVFLIHPGGPFWSKKDLNAWSIPKGELIEGENPLQTAVREFEEETGFRIQGDFLALDPVKQKGGKTVHCFAVDGDIDPSLVKSNSFTIEWSPASGLIKSFPEVDRAQWFDLETASIKINKAQCDFLEQLKRKLGLF